MGSCRYGVLYVLHGPGSAVVPSEMNLFASAHSLPVNRETGRQNFKNSFNQCMLLAQRKKLIPLHTRNRAAERIIKLTTQLNMTALSGKSFLVISQYICFPTDAIIFISTYPTRLTKNPAQLQLNGVHFFFGLFTAQQI